MKLGIALQLAKLIAAASTTENREQGKSTYNPYLSTGCGIFFPKKSTRIKNKIIMARKKRAHKSKKEKSSCGVKMGRWY
jgi:hypothetical protein